MRRISFIEYCMLTAALTAGIATVRYLLEHAPAVESYDFTCKTAVECRAAFQKALDYLMEDETSVFVVQVTPRSEGVTAVAPQP